MSGWLRWAATRAVRRNRSTKPPSRSNAGAKTSIAAMRPTRRPWASYTSAILPRLTSSPQLTEPSGTAVGPTTKMNLPAEWLERIFS
jgi:hypothetical protein